jgi:tripartite-type tricarboxylate transporter receptor subunit TctC
MRRDNSKSSMFFQISLGALVLILFTSGVSSAQTSFFQGKTVTILESSGPGGVGSMRTKAVVPFLQKYIPGNPTVVIQYMDGGGGRKAANHLYKSVRPDGLTIGRMSTPFVMHSILGESGVLYDIDKVTYLGTSYSGGYHVFLTRKEAGFDSLEKLRGASGVRIGAQSVGHLIYISGRMFTYLIGPKQPRFITGYDARELDIAIERGEIDARSTVADSMLHENREWVDKNLMDFHGIIEIQGSETYSSAIN